MPEDGRGCVASLCCVPIGVSNKGTNDAARTATIMTSPVETVAPACLAGRRGKKRSNAGELVKLGYCRWQEVKTIVGIVTGPGISPSAPIDKGRCLDPDSEPKRRR